MTVHAIVVSMDNSTTDFTTAEYVINVVYVFTDGTIATGDSRNNQEIRVPFSLSAKKIDAMIRQKISDYLSSVNSLTIDPDDIYIPFAAR